MAVCIVGCQFSEAADNPAGRRLVGGGATRESEAISVGREGARLSSFSFRVLHGPESDLLSAESLTFREMTLFKADLKQGCSAFELQFESEKQHLDLSPC